MSERASRKEWRTHKFEDMAIIVNNRIDDPSEADVDYYVGLEHLDPESLTIRRWGSPSDVEATKLRFRAGDIIFGRRRVYQRKLAVADFDGICSAHAMVLRARPDVALPEFLPFFMHSDLFMQRAIEISVGSLSPTINWKTLAAEEFMLPPVEEQRRIAALLQRVWALQDVNQKLVNAVRETHQALRVAIFGNDGSGGRPAWSQSTLGQVATFLDGKRVPLKDSDRAVRQGPYPYYGASGVIDYIDGFIFDEELLLISEDGANLVDRSTPIAFLAEGKYWVNNHAHVLRAVRPYSNFLLAQYIESLSLAPFITGTAQPKLNKAALEAIPIPVPPDSVLVEIEEVLRQNVQSVVDCEIRKSATDALLRSAVSSLLTRHLEST